MCVSYAHIYHTLLFILTQTYIGTGASVIYPLLGASAYGWKFIGSECNEESFVSAQRIVSANAAIRNDIQIDVRFQASSSNILTGVLKEDEMIDFVMCNPPFFESEGDRGLKQNLD
jgi:23S rRNA (adenine1618-N6)-methyltransferase